MKRYSNKSGMMVENQQGGWVKHKDVNEDGLHSNMQYYMEYCQSNGYVTPQDWLKNHKHF